MQREPASGTRHEIAGGDGSSIDDPSVPPARVRWMAGEAQVFRRGDQIVLFGRGATGARLGRVVARRGWSRPVVLASRSSATATLPRLVEGGLADVDIVDTIVGVPQHSPAAWTEEAAERVAPHQPDAVISVGGGSVSDAAKAMATLLGVGGRLADHWRGAEAAPPPSDGAPLPVVAIPTTLSGAEVTDGAGAFAGGRKHTLWGPGMRARIVAYDPEILALSPREVLVATGMNALAHCAEALYSPVLNPAVTALAVAATEHLAAGLRRLADPGSIEPACESLAPGAALAGLALGGTRVGLHHAICHSLGSKAGAAHGDGNSVMLPFVLAFNEGASRDGQSVFARALGCPNSSAAEAVTELAERIGAPRRLRDISVSADVLDLVADETMDDLAVGFNPRNVTRADVRTLLDQAF